jgi:hypothetical protein
LENAPNPAAGLENAAIETAIERLRIQELIESPLLYRQTPEYSWFLQTEIAYLRPALHWRRANLNDVVDTHLDATISPRVVFGVEMSGLGRLQASYEYQMSGSPLQRWTVPQFRQAYFEAHQLDVDAVYCPNQFYFEELGSHFYPYAAIGLRLALLETAISYPTWPSTRFRDAFGGIGGHIDLGWSLQIGESGWNVFARGGYGLVDGQDGEDANEPPSPIVLSPIFDPNLPIDAQPSLPAKRTISGWMQSARAEAGVSWSGGLGTGVLKLAAGYQVDWWEFHPAMQVDYYSSVPLGNHSLGRAHGPFVRLEYQF